MTATFSKTKSIAILIITALLAMSFAQAVSAAETAVIGIEFEESADVHLYVEQDTKQLKVFAELSGQSSKKDVTAEAYWVSSDPTVVRVDKGLLTPIKKGISQISAKYSGKTITLSVTVDYLFESLSISASGTIELDLGDTEQLQAIAVDEDEMSYTVTNSATWSTSNSQVVTVEKGLLTPVAKGSATITVKHKGLTATATVKVASPYTSLSIETDDSLELLVGQTPVELSAYAVKSGGGKEEVTEDAAWGSSNSGVVTVEKGVLTAKAQGTAKITASYLGVSNTVTVVVRMPFQALKLTQDGDINMFLYDDPVVVNAKVMENNPAGELVTSLGTWTSSNPVAVSVTVGADGASIAPKSAGTSVVKFEHRGLSQQILVTVYPTITGLELADESLELYKGDKEELPEVGGLMLSEELIDVSGMAVWTSSNTDVLTVEDGEMKALKPGKSVLTAKIKNFTASVEVTVQEKVLILLPEKNMVSMVVGSEANYPKVNAVLEDGTEIADLTSDIQWKSSSTSLLLKDGAMKALLAGKATLTGTYLNQKVTISVTMEPEIVKFEVTPVSIDLNPGKTKMISVKGFYKDGKSVSLSTRVEWTSSNPEIASVSRSTVKALKEGQVTLTASYQDKPLKVTVRVVPKLKKLTADQTSVKLKAGKTERIALTALFDTGKQETVSSHATWTTSNSSVAVVDANGTIRGVKKGSATIKAVYQNKTVTIRVKVE